MNWFEQLCRNTGLMVHHAIKPLRKDKRTVVRKEVEEKKISETVTLRRTTIEEIEVKGQDGEESQ